MQRSGLVERAPTLALLSGVAAALRDGTGGQLVLVAGEAGAGKSAVIDAFIRSLPTGVDHVLGWCDSLRTPRPLAPLSDWAMQRDPALATAIADGTRRSELFDRALELLAREPIVAVIEDAHWADDATLDLLSFLGRRLDRTRAAVIVTYRSDEIGRSHPLAAVLGDLASTGPMRVSIPAISAAGVAELMDDGHEAHHDHHGHDDHDDHDDHDGAVDHVELHRRTGGNAFFITECLSSVAGIVPVSVREAVLARASRLGPDARSALDAIAIVPGRAELWLAEALGSAGPAVDECVELGVLVNEGGTVRFRHELARESIDAALLPSRRLALHHRAISSLLSPPGRSVDHARVTHHAVHAGDIDVVLAHAPAAATAAVRAGARREAVAHLELAIEHAGSLTSGDQLDLWSRLAEQRALLGHHLDAIVAYERAIELAGAVGVDDRRGELLARMWAPLSMAGEVARAAEVVTGATELLEGRFESSGLALAYAQRCAQHMLARELDLAATWGDAAIRLATRLDDREVLAYALIQQGVAAWMSGDEQGLANLRRGTEMARRGHLTNLVAQGLSQIGSGGGEIRRYPEAIQALEECVTLAETHQLGSRGLYASAWLARCDFELARWDDASRRLSAVLRSPRCDGATRITALTALGRLRARRGDPDVWSVLDEALLLALPTGHLQRLWPIAAARAEAAWLEGRPTAELDLLEQLHGRAASLTSPWAFAELGFWLWRAGRLHGVDEGPDGEAAPFALHSRGRIRDAADAWERIGCSYERASALADSSEDGDQRAALVLFESLGARPARQMLADRRRADGRRVPRGPNGATRGNPANLTDREIDVLRLVATGATSREAAEHLRITAKTVDHHVAHAMTKLDARSRAEAVLAATRLGVPLEP